MPSYQGRLLQFDACLAGLLPAVHCFCHVCRAQPGRSQPGPVAESAETSGWAADPGNTCSAAGSSPRQLHSQLKSFISTPNQSSVPVCEAYQVDSSYDGDAEDEGPHHPDLPHGHGTHFSALYNQPLRSTEADREAALLGAASEAEDEEQQGARRLCVRSGHAGAAGEELPLMYFTSSHS